MSKRQTLLLTFLLTVMAGCHHDRGAHDKPREDHGEQHNGILPSGGINSSAAHGKRALLEAYPDFVKSIDGNNLLMSDGTTIVYDDGLEKGFVELLDNSDPDDMFFTVYDSHKIPPAYLSDAGRSRCETLFKYMYGSSASAVERNLTEVDWFGTKVRFTRINGAAKHLQSVAEEIGRHPELLKWVDCSGTYYWRKVRGAERQSAHSYGIAIDIAVKNSDYWLWKNPKASETDRIEYANKIPRTLVDIFERHGFIWGGSWYHYDTMHFEYRPEILRYSGLRNGEHATG